MRSRYDRRSRQGDGLDLARLERSGHRRDVVEDETNRASRRGPAKYVASSRVHSRAAASRTSTRASDADRNRSRASRFYINNKQRRRRRGKESDLKPRGTEYRSARRLRVSSSHARCILARCTSRRRDSRASSSQATALVGNDAATVPASLQAGEIEFRSLARIGDRTWNAAHPRARGLAHCGPETGPLRRSRAATASKSTSPTLGRAETCR